MSLIHLERLVKVYRSGVRALDDIDYEYPLCSSILLFVGPNGAGKTTLVGELSPTRGYVEIAGMDPERARLHGLLGVMPQEAELHEYLSVREYLYYLALIKGLGRGSRRRYSLAARSTRPPQARECW